MQHSPLHSLDESESFQDQSSSNLHRYLKEIDQYKLLTSEESNRLAVQYLKTGDHKAADKLVVANLRLVVKIASTYQNYWQANFLDLIQEGNAGLVRAVKKYDPARGVKFTSYASYWVKAYILKFIMDNWRVVKITTTPTMRRMFFNYYKEKKFLESQGKKADPGALAERLQVKQSELSGVSERLYGTDLSLNAPVSDDSDMSIQDRMVSNNWSVQDKVEQQDLYSKIHEILKKEKDNLSPREELILFKRLFSDSPLTLQNLGDSLKISKERVRQIENGLVEKLKSVLYQELGGESSWVH